MHKTQDQNIGAFEIRSEGDAGADDSGGSQPSSDDGTDGDTGTARKKATK
jgi:hypothetical protein